MKLDLEIFYFFKWFKYFVAYLRNLVQTPVMKVIFSMFSSRNFKSLVVCYVCDLFWVNFGTWDKLRLQIHCPPPHLYSTNGISISTICWIDYSFFMNYLGIFEKPIGICVWFYFCTLCFVLLFFISTCCQYGSFDYCCEFSNFVFWKIILATVIPLHFCINFYNQLVSS